MPRCSEPGWTASQPTSDEPDAPRYGYALAEMGPFFGHTGELPGYNSFMGRRPRGRCDPRRLGEPRPDAAGTDPATEIAKTLIGELYTRG